MDFKEILTQLLDRTPGGLGAALVAKDGLIVEMHSKKDFQLEEIAVHITQPLTKSEDSVRNSDFGVFEELLLFTDKYSLILKDITEEYFLMLIVDKNEGIYGKGRFEAEKILRVLKPELV